MFRLATLLLILLKSPLTYSYELDRAKENLADEMIECAAYYCIIGGGHLSSDPKETRDYRDASTTLLLLAHNLSQQKIESIEASMRIFYNQQMQEIDNDSVNISILLDKHGEKCKGIIENPEKRAKYWLAKKD